MQICLVRSNLESQQLSTLKYVLYDLFSSFVSVLMWSFLVKLRVFYFYEFQNIRFFFTYLLSPHTCEFQL